MKENRSILIDRERISKRINEMAKELSKTFDDKKVVVIGILGGAFMFMADLVRRADFVTEVDFLWLESYEGTKSTGKIKVRQEVDVNLKGKNVLILDDILDTGLTLDFTRKHMLERGAKSVKAAVLLRKERDSVDLSLAETVGFVIPDKFVIGYGLDYNGKYRQLPDIWVLKEPVE